MKKGQGFSEEQQSRPERPLFHLRVVQQAAFIAYPYTRVNPFFFFCHLLRPCIRQRLPFSPTSLHGPSSRPPSLQQPWSTFFFASSYRPAYLNLHFQLRIHRLLISLPPFFFFFFVFLLDTNGPRVAWSFLDTNRP
jgi:hypothetical protein